ncbi:MAG: phosphoglycerate dehydrogenase [Bacillota bacterium]|nr:phosphoglycerate dehydrogenase [Bacillota bacterium]
MAASKRVLVAERIAEEGLERLRQAGLEVLLHQGGRERLLEEVAAADGLVVRSATRVDRELLAAAPRLSIVGRAGVGVDNVDVAEATRRGVVVVNVPDGNTLSAAEHTFALMLAMVRHLPAADAALRAGRWERHLVGVQLYGKTLGIVGMGRIGRQVALRALAFGMRVLAHDPYLGGGQSVGDVRLVGLEELLGEADILTVHTPLTPQTRHLIGAREIALMKPGAYVVNCARGGIVDEEALAVALREGRLAGAALDVWEEEPPRPDHPLLQLDRVVVTPHLGASTVEAQRLNAETVADELIRWFAGRPVRNAVNLPPLSEEEWAAVRPFLGLAGVLGPFFVQALPTRLEQVSVGLSLQGRAAELVASAVLAGLLGAVLNSPLNLVNAAAVAAEQGIHWELRSERDGLGHQEVALEAGPAGARRRLRARLDPDGRPRIVALDDFPIDLVPTRHMLLSRHADRPGIVGRFGSILGERGINIAEMRLGRSAPGGEAVMVLGTDQPVDEATMEALSAIEPVEELRRIELGPWLPPGA